MHNANSAYHRPMLHVLVAKWYSGKQLGSTCQLAMDCRAHSQCDNPPAPQIRLNCLRKEARPGAPHQLIRTGAMAQTMVASLSVWLRKRWAISEG